MNSFFLFFFDGHIFYIFEVAPRGSQTDRRFTQWLFVQSGHPFHLRENHETKSHWNCFHNGVSQLDWSKRTEKFVQLTMSRNCPFAIERNWRSIHRITRWSCLLFTHLKVTHFNNIHTYTWHVITWIRVGLTIYRIPIIWSRWESKCKQQIV